MLRMNVSDQCGAAHKTTAACSFPTGRIPVFSNIHRAFLEDLLVRGHIVVKCRQPYRDAGVAGSCAKVRVSDQRCYG